MIHSTEFVVLGEDGRGPSVSAIDRTVEQLEDEITTLCAHIGAAEQRLLRAIGEFDARKGWAGIGIASCAHWLNWRCGISLVAAHDKVRVARALRSLPEISAAMGRGELSYSKVRALTRVATPENESALVTLAKQGTAAHVEEIVRRYRRMQRVDETINAAQKQRERELRYHWDDDGTLVVHARLPAEQGALVLKALDAAAETLRRVAHREDAPHSSAEDSAGCRANSSAEDSTAPTYPDISEVLTSSPFLPDESFSARRAGALTLMAETLLSHGAAELSPSERHQVVIHIDAAVLSDARCDGRAEIENGPPLEIETVRRLLCDANIIPMTDDADGNPLNVGHRTRAIPPALRRALKSRDGGCRFPGCSHKRFADGHHIEHWADGGETKLDNLVLLCRTHHRLVHEEGFRVVRTADGRLAFHAPNGRHVEDAPARCMLAHDPVLALVDANRALGIGAHTCIPEWMGEKPDYDWITDALWRRDERARGAAQGSA